VPAEYNRVLGQKSVILYNMSQTNDPWQEGEGFVQVLVLFFVPVPVL
jgi:hypothetical protein